MKREGLWYVLQVLTGTEQGVTDRLKAAGMEALAPVEVLHERRHGNWWLRRKTLFPSYVFVRTDMTPRIYHYLKHLPNVIRLLGTDTPEPVPADQMEIIQCFDNAGLDFGPSEGEKRDGKTVITSGPLAPLEEMIMKVNARSRRATLEIPILGDTYQVEVGLVLKQTSQPAEEAGPAETDSNPEEPAR